MSNRKPNRRTVNRIARATAEYLRELVATFCRERGGTPAAGPFKARQYNSVIEGIIGAEWHVPTRFGMWIVHEPSDPATGLVSINTRFEDPDALSAAVIQGVPGIRALDFNPRSGKWNHHAEVLVENDPKTVAESFLLDLKHRSSFLFTTLSPSPSDAASCDERVAPGLLADGDGARSLGAAGDEVRGQRRAATARVAGDDQDGVLSQDAAQVGREALGLGGERCAPAAIVLRTEDVQGQAGLALTQEDTRGRRDGVAGEVAVRGRRDGRRGLLRVDGPSKRRTGKRAALAEAHDDADRARGDGAAEGAGADATEGHVLSVVQVKRVLKKWAAPDYVLIWFDKGDPTRARLTVEHVDPLRAVYLVRGGWRECQSGRYTRTVPLAELASTLATIGRVISRPDPI